MGPAYAASVGPASIDIAKPCLDKPSTRHAAATGTLGEEPELEWSDDAAVAGVQQHVLNAGGPFLGCHQAGPASTR